MSPPVACEPFFFISSAACEMYTMQLYFIHSVSSESGSKQPYGVIGGTMGSSQIIRRIVVTPRLLPNLTFQMHILCRRSSLFFFFQTRTQTLNCSCALNLTFTPFLLLKAFDRRRRKHIYVCIHFKGESKKKTNKRQIQFWMSFSSPDCNGKENGDIWNGNKRQTQASYWKNRTASVTIKNSNCMTFY